MKTRLFPITRKYQSLVLEFETQEAHFDG